MPLKAATEEPVSRQFRWHRAAAIGFATLFVLSAVWGYWLGHAQPRPVDFLSFWAAGRLALHGKAAMAYNLVSHRLMEQTAAPIKGLLPFPYPPPFLLAVSPFALLPYWTALAFWVVVTAIIYLVAVRKFAPLPYSLAHPAVPVNSWIGQNGFLTCGIFAMGLAALDVSPLAGGAIFGLLIIKPQLALLIPIAFVAGRQWWGIVGAASSTLLLLAIGYALFGPSPYEGFVQALPHQASVIANGRVPWNELASPFAFCRLLGISKEHSLAIQAIIAILAGAITWRAWWLGLDSRGPVLAAATLLIPPYLFTYDSLLLIIPIGWLVRYHTHPVGLAVIWLLCLLPVISYSGAYTGPNTIPVAALLCLWLLHVDEKASEARKRSAYASAHVRSAESQHFVSWTVRVISEFPFSSSRGLRPSARAERRGRRLRSARSPARSVPNWRASGTSAGTSAWRNKWRQSGTCVHRARGGLQPSRLLASATASG